MATKWFEIDGERVANPFGELEDPTSVLARLKGELGLSSQGPPVPSPDMQARMRELGQDRRPAADRPELPAEGRSPQGVSAPAGFGGAGGAQQAQLLQQIIQQNPQILAQLQQISSSLSGGIEIRL